MNLKENDMGVITRDEVREILEEIIKDQAQINTAENTNEIQSKPTATKSTEVPWRKGETMNDRTRQIEVTITLTSSDSFKLIKEDIEAELCCCWHTFDGVEITEKVVDETDWKDDTFEYERLGLIKKRRADEHTD